MKLLLKRYNLIALVCIMCCLACSAGNVLLTAKLDSAVLLMGNTTALHLELTQDEKTQGFFPLDRVDTLNAMVEVAGRPKADTTNIGNNRITIKKDYIIQSFDSGMYVLPPVQYIVGGDTIKSNTLAIKVIPVKVDTTKAIKDIKPPLGVPFKFFDLVPDFVADYWWLWLLLALLISAWLYYYFKWYKKGRKNPLKAIKKRLPPYEEAMAALQALKNKQLWQNGQEKAYYTALTDILRVYIDRRFGINAIEMTSQQIVKHLTENAETKPVKEQVAEILEIADFVKFANQHPLADDNEKSFARAMEFVENTKPAEPVNSNSGNVQQPVAKKTEGKK